MGPCWVRVDSNSFVAFRLFVWSWKDLRSREDKLSTEDVLEMEDQMQQLNQVFTAVLSPDNAMRKEGRLSCEFYSLDSPSSVLRSQFLVLSNQSAQLPNISFLHKAIY